MNIERKKQGYGNQKVTATFDSITEYTDYIRENARPNGHSVTYEGRSEFCHDSYDEAMEKLTFGWRDGVEKLDNIKAEIQRTVDTADDKAYTVAYDVTGQYIDVGRVMTGEPENFGSIELEETTKQSILIHVSASFAACVNKQNVFNRGAAILAIIEKLRTKYHVVVELVRRTDYSSNGAVNGYIEFESRIRVDTGREFSRDGLAFCLANEAFNRRTQFALNEILFETDYCESYGHSIDATKATENTLFFPVMQSDDPKWNTIESSSRAVERILEDFNRAQDTQREVN